MAIIPYAHEDPQDDRAAAVVDKLPEPRINLFTMLANAPALVGPTLRLGEAILTRGDLPAHLRELAILQAARTTDTEYEWVQHEAIARAVGMTDEQIEACRNGDADDLVLRFTEEVVRDAAPSDETFAAMAERFPPRQIVELILVIGNYMMLARLMATAQIDLDEPVGARLISDAP
jgi:4-carboxymuconolactone decarboxylase